MPDRSSRNEAIGYVAGVSSNVFDRDDFACQAGFRYRGAPATVIGSPIYRW